MSKKCILRNSGHPFEIAKREKSLIYFTHFYFLEIVLRNKIKVDDQLIWTKALKLNVQVPN